MNRREKNKRKKLKTREERIKANTHIRWRKRVEKKRAEKELYFLEREVEKIQNKAFRAAERAEQEKDNKKD